MITNTILRSILQLYSDCRTMTMMVIDVFHKIWESPTELFYLHLGSR